MSTLPIWVNKSVDSSGSKSLTGSVSKDVLENVPTESLTKNLNVVCSTLGQVFQDIKEVGNMTLQELTIQVEVSASGGINLIGSAQMGGKGAITLKFAEPPKETSAKATAE